MWVFDLAATNFLGPWRHTLVDSRARYVFVPNKYGTGSLPGIAVPPTPGKNEIAKRTAIAMDNETAAAMDEGLDYFPLDVFVEILLRLPTSARRRFRLVCRRWREVIDTHTTEMESRPKALAFVGDLGAPTVSAHVVDDLSEGISRKLWTGHCPDVAMVGTYNGLFCLCARSKPGEITLVNPVTGETLLLPPLSTAGQPELDDIATTDYKAYNFAYHPVTGKYKILHVPCSGAEKFDVLTLGDASWRAVATPGASCNLDHGLVTMDGTMFWITAGTKPMIMSLDLEHEILTSTKPLPALQKERVLHLVEVHGRLGVTTVTRSFQKNTQIWVLGDDQGWSRRYSVYVDGPTVYSLAQPHFAQDKHILMKKYTHQRWIVCRHIPRDKGLQPSLVLITSKERGTALAGISGRTMQTFSYVETTEPLSCYNPIERQ